MARAEPVTLRVEFYQLPGRSVILTSVRMKGKDDLSSNTFGRGLTDWDPKWSTKSFVSLDKATRYLRKALRAMGYSHKHPSFEWIDTTSSYESQSPYDSYESDSQENADE